MPIRILIVDDNPKIRALLRSSIERSTNWSVCGEAENGEVAIKMVAALRPDLVVLDLSMPVMNGLDAAKRISAISPGLPMIMFTLHESRALEEQANAAGITHVFPKENGFDEYVLNAMRAMLAA